MFEEILGRHVSVQVEAGQKGLRVFVGVSLRGRVIAASPVATRVQPARMFIDLGETQDPRLVDAVLVVQLPEGGSPPTAAHDPIPVECTLWDEAQSRRLGEGTGLLTILD